MTIRAFSLDFDLSLFHKDYTQSKEKNVVKSNQPFLNKIREENKKFRKVYTFVGSNRQSFHIDRAGDYMNGTGSCFPALQQISIYLGAYLDTFLLADIYGDLPNGTSFANATNESSTIEDHKNSLFDETKVTILYAQIHKIANENPGEDIVFDFYDDGGNGEERRRNDILQQLQKFYTKHSDLIPKNVTLRLHHYAGKEDSLIDEGEIKGTGFIDSNYKQTVKDLAQQSILQGNNGLSKPIYVAEFAKPGLLQNRAWLLVENENSLNDVNAIINNGAETQAARDKFIAAIVKINQKADKLAEKSNNLFDYKLRDEQQSKDYHSYKSAAKAARAHSNALLNAAVAYFQNYDAEAFKVATDYATQIAMNSELQNHRGYLKQILAYSGLAILAILSIATLGLAYAVAGGVNYAVNRQFFFSTKINTDSVNQVIELQNAAAELIAPTA